MVDPTSAGQAVGSWIDWLNVHRGQLEAAGGFVVYVWAWVAHKQPDKVYDAGGLFPFILQILTRKR